jgi:hypothetical protein
MAASTGDSLLEISPHSGSVLIAVSMRPLIAGAERSIMPIDALPLSVRTISWRFLVISSKRTQVLNLRYVGD